MADPVKGPTCPDCGRTRASSRPADDWEQYEDEDCFAEYDTHPSAPHKLKEQCLALTITRLRYELAEKGRSIAELEEELTRVRGRLQAANEELELYW